MQGAPLFLHTQLRTLYHGGGQGLPSTIVFACGLSLPIAVVWGTKYPRGAKGSKERFFYINVSSGHFKQNFQNVQKCHGKTYLINILS